MYVFDLLTPQTIFLVMLVSMLADIAAAHLCKVRELTSDVNILAGNRSN